MDPLVTGESVWRQIRRERVCNGLTVGMGILKRDHMAASGGVCRFRRSDGVQCLLIILRFPHGCLGIHVIEKVDPVRTLIEIIGCLTSQQSGCFRHVVAGRIGADQQFQPGADLHLFPEDATPESDGHTGIGG